MLLNMLLGRDMSLRLPQIMGDNMLFKRPSNIDYQTLPNGIRSPQTIIRRPLNNGIQYVVLITANTAPGPCEIQIEEDSRNAPSTNKIMMLTDLTDKFSEIIF
jgi:hypothetical protein